MPTLPHSYLAPSQDASEGASKHHPSRPQSCCPCTYPPPTHIPSCFLHTHVPTRSPTRPFTRDTDPPSAHYHRRHHQAATPPTPCLAECLSAATANSHRHAQFPAHITGLYNLVCLWGGQADGSITGGGGRADGREGVTVKG